MLKHEDYLKSKKTINYINKFDETEKKLFIKYVVKWYELKKGPNFMRNFRVYKSICCVNGEEELDQLYEKYLSLDPNSYEAILIRYR